MFIICENRFFEVVVMFIMKFESLFVEYWVYFRWVVIGLIGEINVVFLKGLCVCIDLYDRFLIVCKY